MRECDCGCGAPMVGLSRHTRFRPECARRRHLERKRAERDKKRPALAAQARLREQRRSLDPRVTFVVAHHDPNRPQTICSVCGGMPSARTLDRVTDGRYAQTVLDPATGRCRGCGEPPGEDRPLERGAVIRSSAGTAAAHGRYHGY